MTTPKDKELTQTQIDEGRSLLHDFKNVLDDDFEECAENIAQALAAAREEGRQEINGEFEKAKAVITEANNSLYGSQGYFLGMEGGFDKYHLARPIEKLKETARPLPTNAPEGESDANDGHINQADELLHRLRITIGRCTDEMNDSSAPKEFFELASVHAQMSETIAHFLAQALPTKEQ